jgi:hypothetical protein
MTAEIKIQRFVDFYNQLSAQNLGSLTEVYDQQVVFIDPVHKICGLPALEQYFEHAYARLQSCQFEVLSAAGQQHTGFVNWTMRFSHQAIGNGKLISVEGCSALQFNDQGLIVHHRDYYDLTDMVYQHVPVLSWLTAAIKRKMADQ